MYLKYRKSIGKDSTRFQLSKRISLFGCRSGEIIHLLRSKLSSSDTEPFKWHLNVEECLGDQTLIINLKPNAKDNNLSLYEIMNVWGFSNSNWTPIMLHLRGLFSDDTTNAVDDKDFTCDHDRIDDPIFSMLYLNGSVREGEITGKWTAPRPSPTNSCLLWPEVFDYFESCKRNLSPLSLTRD